MILPPSRANSATGCACVPDSLQFQNNLTVFGAVHRLLGGDERIQIRNTARGAFRGHLDGMLLHYGIFSHAGDLRQDASWRNP